MLTRIALLISSATLISSCMATKHVGLDHDSGLASSAPSSSTDLKIIFPLPLDDSKMKLADINAALRKAGKKVLPSVITLDLKANQQTISKEYYEMNSNIGTINGAGNLGSVPDKGACFIGKNTAVANAIAGKLPDSWLSDQFVVGAVSTANPDHIGIRYSVTDDGDDVNWLNLDRCK